MEEINGAWLGNRKLCFCQGHLRQCRQQQESLIVCVSPHPGKGIALDVCGLGALLCYLSSDQGPGTSHRLTRLFSTIYNLLHRFLTSAKFWIFLSKYNRFPIVF